MEFQSVCQAKIFLLNWAPGPRVQQCGPGEQARGGREQQQRERRQRQQHQGQHDHLLLRILECFKKLILSM